MTSLRHKLWLGFGGLLTILLIVSGMTVVVMTRYSHALERVFRENYDSAVFCDSMNEALDQLNTRAQFVAWQVSPPTSIDADAQRQKFQDNLLDQLDNCTLPGELDHTNALADFWRQYRDAYDQFDSASPDQRPELYRSRLLPLYRQMKESTQWIASNNMSNMVSVDGRIKQTLLDVRNALLVLVITGTVAAALVVGAAGASILRPLAALTRSAREIESGNLDLILPVGARRDEIGVLSEAFNAMTAQLREFRRLDHDRLVRTQQTTQLAIDSLPDAVFIVGPDGKIEISNRTAREHFGIEPDATVAVLSFRLKWLARLYESIHEGREQPESPGYSAAIQFFDHGVERFLLPRAVPMIGPQNTQIGVAFILVDVTRLRAADEAKGAIVSTISHELRTPLTSLRMAINLLSGDKIGPVNEKQKSLLGAASVESDRLYRIIENLLSISRIESGRAEFQLRPIPPAEIISQSVDPLRESLTEKSIQLDISAPATLPAVQADPGVIGLVLTNLLSNALKFTPSGGKISIAAEPNGRFVIFSVADTGPGIPAQFSGRIFDKFFRIPQKDGPTGAGLGLSIAKEVIEAHGGSIELCKDHPQGSKFRFTLPQTHSITAT
jgi:NtrC-family two-component system sensor histidine kinase KinB